MPPSPTVVHRLGVLPRTVRLSIRRPQRSRVTSGRLSVSSGTEYGRNNIQNTLRPIASLTEQAAATLISEGVYSYTLLLTQLGTPFSLGPVSNPDAIVNGKPQVLAGNPPPPRSPPFFV